MLSYANVAVIHLVAVGFMVGLIWTIHVVHYPLFALVPEPYRPYQEAHMLRITRLLAVPWGVESATAVALLFLADPGEERVLAVVGLVLLVAVVAVTGLLAAPAHGRLLEHFDSRQHARLMRIDLVRTLLWSLRGLVAVVMVTQQL